MADPINIKIVPPPAIKVRLLGDRGPTGPAGPAGATGQTGATGPAGTTSWNGIEDKPSTFPPSSSTSQSLGVGELRIFDPVFGDYRTLHVSDQGIFLDAIEIAPIHYVEAQLLTKAASSHAHGNITNAGAIGSTASLVVVTGASGVLTVASTLPDANLSSNVPLKNAANVFSTHQTIQSSTAGASGVRAVTLEGNRPELHFKNTVSSHSSVVIGYDNYIYFARTNSSGTFQNWVAGFRTDTSQLAVGHIVPGNAILNVRNPSASPSAVVGLFQGAASQTGLLIECDDSTGATVASIGANGELLIAAPGTFSGNVADIRSNGVSRLVIPTASARVVWQTSGIQIQTSGAGAGGITLNGTASASNTITGSAGFTLQTSTTPAAAGADVITIFGASSQATSGTTRGVRFNQNFNPTSGTGVFSAVNVDHQINQTGGANGITRGIYVNPTLTAAANYRAIESSNNTGFQFYAAGTANSYFGGPIQVAAGTGARAGNATLVGGTVTISMTSATANTVVLVSRKTAGGTTGDLRYSVTAGASITITSSSASDTSVVSYFAIEA